MLNKFTVLFLMAASVAVVSSFSDLEQNDGVRQYETGPIARHLSIGVQEQDQYRHTVNIEEYTNEEEAWERFKEMFDRHYSTLDEENFRKDIFLATLRGVREHNERYKNHEVSYSQGINQFSDMTQQELQTGTGSRPLGRPLEHIPEYQQHRYVNIEDILDDDEAWEMFKRKFNRHYLTPEEEYFHRDIFIIALRRIREHNQRYKNQEVTYRLSIDQFCDLSQEEMSSTMRQYGTRPIQRHYGTEDIYTVNIEEIENDDEAWEIFKKKFDRHYSTFDEENYRRDIFLATLRSVREHNEWYKNKQVSYSQCINEFSDLTQDEFQNGSTMSHYGTRHVYKELSRDRSDQLDLTLDS